MRLLFRSCRLFLRVLGVRMWLVKAWPRLILPEAVFEKRLAAPRLVLIFGIAVLLVLDSLLFFGLGRDDHEHAPSFHLRGHLDNRHILDCLDNLVQGLLSELHVGYLAAPENQGHLGLVSFLQEA